MKHFPTPEQEDIDRAKSVLEPFCLSGKMGQAAKEMNKHFKQIKDPKKFVRRLGAFLDYLRKRRKELAAAIVIYYLFDRNYCLFASNMISIGCDFDEVVDMIQTDFHHDFEPVKYKTLLDEFDITFDRLLYNYYCRVLKSGVKDNIIFTNDELNKYVVSTDHELIKDLQKDLVSYEGCPYIRGDVLSEEFFNELKRLNEVKKIGIIGNRETPISLYLSFDDDVVNRYVLDPSGEYQRDPERLEKMRLFAILYPSDKLQKDPAAIAKFKDITANTNNILSKLDNMIESNLKIGEYTNGIIQLDDIDEELYNKYNRIIAVADQLTDPITFDFINDRIILDKHSRDLVKKSEKIKLTGIISMK